MHRLTLLFSLTLLIASCTSAPGVERRPVSPQLFYLQLDPSGDVKLNSFESGTVLPFNLPSDCAVYRLSPNPVLALLAVELECPGGPVVEIIDTQSGQLSSPAGLQQGSARFLAWSVNGQIIYFKTDLVANPRIVRFDYSRSRMTTLNLPPTTYDLGVLPDGRILYSTTLGIGFGSETWLANADGGNAKRILSEPRHIVAYLKPSPDGKRIAFIRFPDSQMPFPDGELWVMEASGKNTRVLAEADAGHGYAPAWSPDGTQLAFVVRENPDDPQVGLSAGALLSNIYELEVQSGVRTAVTRFQDAITETPTWSPDGSTLVFNVARNDTIQVWSGIAGKLQPLSQEMTCCAVWVPGR